ncbi:MAG: HAMP domain-containing histidine kinase [Muribaculaceae bacterium]|nr:HAMP domain-containing histidine kinase [Muribaculaceae bacterium]
MGNILLISEDEQIINRYKNLLNKTTFKFSFCSNQTSVYDSIEVDPADVFIIDGKIQDINIGLTVKKIKSQLDNSQIILITDGEKLDEETVKYLSGYISDSFSDELILSTIESHTKSKNKLDILSGKNKDLADSLYKLNVLYSTSSQFAGTLDTKELLNYMTEGLDRSLSFDLACTISFGFDNEPVLIVNSLYDISEEIMSALKLRAILNYKSLFENSAPPFEIDDTKLKTIKYIKNPNSKFTFSIFQYDNMFAPIDLGDNFFGCIEIFKESTFTTDDATYFQTIVQQVSLPLKSAGLYKEIIKKNEELEKLERVKSEFISIVSHELRTPLTPIKNALSILSSGRCGDLGSNAVKFIDMAKRNVENLTNIINDILDINKIEAGKMDFNYKLMNIHSVIENVKTNFDCVAKEHEINFSTNEQENLPEIYADSQRLGQVLTNLVSNAIKFTPKGKSITIHSELKNANDIIKNPYFEEELKTLSGNYIVVSVVDEGIGIKEENLLKAFDKFTQIENSLSRKVGGTGLGLPIAKQLIKAHKGTIWCDSEEERGSSFYFALPVITENIEAREIHRKIL